MSDETKLYNVAFKIEVSGMVPVHSSSGDEVHDYINDCQLEDLLPHIRTCEAYPIDIEEA